MIPLLSSLRNSIQNSRLFYFLSGDDEIQYGYIIFPTITASPNIIDYFPSENKLVVFSRSSNEVVFISAKDKQINNRVSAEGTNPTNPSLFIPPLGTIYYIGDGGIDSNGIFSISPEGVITTILEKGNTETNKIVYIIYYEDNRKTYFIDEQGSRSIIHTMDDQGVLQTNVINITPNTNNISGKSVDQERGLLFLADGDEDRIIVINLNTETQIYSHNLGYSPTGVTWNPEDSKLYVVGQTFNQLELYNWDTNTSTLVSQNLESLPVYEGLVVGSSYDPIQRKVLIKFVVGYLGKDSFVYLDFNKFTEELVITNILLPQLDINQPLKYIESLDTFYHTRGNSIIGYRAIQVPTKTKVLGGNASIITSIDFPGRRGILAVDDLTISILNERFQVRNNNINLLDLLGDELTSTDSCNFAKYLSLEEERILVLGFTSGRLLVLDKDFTLITKIKTTDITVNVNGTDTLVNVSSVKNSYQVVQIAYSKTFKLLYIGYKDGNSANSPNRNNGSVVVYNVALGIQNAPAVAYVDVPNTSVELSSVEINPSANLIYILSETNGKNSNLQVLDLFPSKGTLVLRSQQLADPNNSKISYFNSRVNFLSQKEATYTHLRGTVSSQQQKIQLDGNLTNLVASNDYGFSFILDTENDYLISISEAYEIYGLVKIPGYPKSLAVYKDSIYVSYTSDAITLPELNETLSSSETINQLLLKQQLVNKVEIGDIIKLSHAGNEYFLTSLSEAFPGDSQLFIDVFTPPENIDPTQAVLTLEGDKIVKINQNAIVREKGVSRGVFAKTYSIENSYSNYYSIPYDPFLLLNNLELYGFQTLNKEFKSLGSRIYDIIKELHYISYPYLYFITEEPIFYRIHLIERYLQIVNLDIDSPIDSIKDFVVYKNDMYVIIKNDIDKKVIKLSLKTETAERIDFETQESLLLDKIPLSLFINRVENSLNIYTEQSTHYKVLLE